MILVNKVLVSICISFWYWNLDVDLFCFEGLFFCFEVELVFFYYFCIFYIDLFGYEFGVFENVFEYLLLFVDDLVD